MGKVETEASARDDLAAVYRMCHKLGLNEGVCNHMSVLVPGTSDRFLVAPYGLLWSEVTPESLVLVDPKGRVVGDGAVDTSAFEIHSAMHAVNPEKNVAVLHTHMPYTTALCVIQNDTPNKERIAMCCQNALRFWNDISYDEIFRGWVLDPEEGLRLAAGLKEKRVGLQKHHAVFICAPTLAQAFDDLYYLEQAAKVQVLAMSTGAPLALVDEDVCKSVKEAFDSERENFARQHLDARKRELSRDDKTLKWLAQPKAKGGYDQSEGDRSPEKVLPGVFKK